jgi:hypothetical protein
MTLAKTLFMAIAAASGLCSVAVSTAVQATADDGPDGCWRHDLSWLPPADRAFAAGDLVVAVDGDDANPGTPDRPLRTLLAARDRLRKRRGGKPGPTAATIVWLRGGRHPIDRTLSLGPNDSGTAAAPIVYQSWPGERASLDGAVAIPWSQFAPVTAPEELARLHPQARGRAVAATIDDPRLTALLESPFTEADIDGTMARRSRFPNQGFAHVGRIVAPGAIYTEGRTTGPPPSFSFESPIGGRFPIREPHEGNWREELAWNRQVRITGYFQFDWHRETLGVAAVDADDVLTLDGYTRYGVRQITPVPRRVFLAGLLGEMDAPGEWCFAATAKRLFVVPPRDGAENFNLWAGPGIVSARSAAYVAFVNVDMSGVADRRSPAVVLLDGCEHVVLAGCTIRNATRMAVSIKGGRSCAVQSCDIHDVTAHLQVEGGVARSLEACRHVVDNCHFTQVEAEDFYGRVAVRGVGMRFTNNLIHDFPGQPCTPAGNDQPVARNEIFNVGFTEGDGGAMYAAAMPWGGYGQLIRHNFLHHLMCVPQLHPRGGIYLDQCHGGTEIVGNVLHKAAHRAILLNGGAGIVVRDNVVTETPIGIFQTAEYAAALARDLTKFASGELRRGDVADYVWRTEQAVGPAGWNLPPWSTRFPGFAAIMNQPDERRLAPIGCEISGNRFSRNGQDFLWRAPPPATAGAAVKRIDITQPAEVAELVAADNRDVPWETFADPEALDFSPRAGREADLPAIPFSRIGLYADRWRPAPPDTSAYRSAVARFFSGLPSYDASARYSIAEQAAGRRLRSGRMLFPPASP